MAMAESSGWGDSVSSISPCRYSRGRRETSAAPREYATPVEVCVRIRPRLPREQTEPRCVWARTGRGGYVRIGEDRDRLYSFACVFDSNSADSQGQEEVFEGIGAPMACNALDGFHTCVFALGQTGTGKTFTLLGTAEEPGLVPRILQRVLGGEGITCRLSFLEIHNDRLRDLLIDPEQEERVPLECRCHPHHGVYVPNLSEIPVSDLASAESLVAAGCRARSVARTGMNLASSRGHAVIQLAFESGAKLCVVDLAGRESERTTLCRGAALTELGYINKSLFHLKSVIHALSKRAAGKTERVPFRNSKLTLLLSECLQGARTFLVATVGPTVGSMEETRATLQLAQAVQQITTQSQRHLAPGKAQRAPLDEAVSIPPSTTRLLLPSNGWPRGRPPVPRAPEGEEDSLQSDMDPCSPSRRSSGAPSLAARLSSLARLDVRALRAAAVGPGPCPWCNCSCASTPDQSSGDASTCASLLSSSSAKSQGSASSSATRSGSMPLSTTGRRTQRGAPERRSTHESWGARVSAATQTPGPTRRSRQPSPMRASDSCMLDIVEAPRLVSVGDGLSCC